MLSIASALRFCVYPLVHHDVFLMIIFLVSLDRLIDDLLDESLL